jgi:chemotaxis signal transduction protein
MTAASPPLINVPIPLGKRFILAQVAARTLAIPAIWVIEILRVEKVKILNLPFYDRLMLGVTHHHGHILPLLSTHLLIDQPALDLPEISTVVRLGSATDEVIKVGLVIDRAIGSISQSEIPAAAVIFDPQMIQSNIWRPSH